MTKDTDALREALSAHYPAGLWRQPCGNHVLCCDCGENLWGVDRDACKAAWRIHVTEALTPDTIGSHFGNGGGFDPGAVVQGYPGLPMSDAELSKHYEASKMDAVSLVGSEVRQIIGELRHYRAHPPHPAPVDGVAGGHPYSVEQLPLLLEDHVTMVLECETEAHVVADAVHIVRLAAQALRATAPVDPVAGGEALAKYAGMDLDERAEAMADNCDGDPWELIGYFREKLRQSRESASDWKSRALAALQGPAA